MASLKIPPLYPYGRKVERLECYISDHDRIIFQVIWYQVQKKKCQVTWMPAITIGKFTHNKDRIYMSMEPEGGLENARC